MIPLCGLLWAQADSAKAVLELNPVVIHAERIPLLRPRGVELSEGGHVTIGEALISVPGVEWMQTGGAFVGRPVLRGHSYTRVGWLLGGLPREGAYWGEDHGYETPPQLLTFQPEILLGPQSVRYGSDAIGGIVRFQPLVPGRSFFSAQAIATTNPLGGLLQAAGAIGTAERFLMGEAILQSAENFYTPRQHFVWNTGMRGAYGYLTGRLPVPRGLVELSAFQTLQLIGIPSPLWDAEEKIWFSEAEGRYIQRRDAWRFRRDLPFQRILSSGAQARLLWEGSSGATTALILGVQQNIRAEYGETPDAPEVLIKTRRADVDLSRRWGGWEGGFTGFLRSTRDEGEEPFLPSILHGEGGFWVRHGVPLAEGRLALGGRLHGAFSQAGNTRYFLTWAAELSYARRWWIARLTRSFRIPHPAELWADGFHEGAKRYEYGRPDLPVEVAYTAEALFMLKGFELRPFVQYFPVYIFAERLPDTLPTVVGAAFTYGVRRALLTGGEIEWQSKTLTVGISYTLGQFLAQRHPAERFIPRIPPLRMRLAWRHSWRDWTFSPELLLYAPQHRAYTLYDTEVPTPGYVLLNLTIHRRWLAFGVQNALGTRYQPHLSPYRQWVPGGIDFPVWNAFVRLSL